MPRSLCPAAVALKSSPSSPLSSARRSANRACGHREPAVRGLRGALAAKGDEPSGCMPKDVVLNRCMPKALACAMRLHSITDIASTLRGHEFCIALRVRGLGLRWVCCKPVLQGEPYLSTLAVQWYQESLLEKRVACSVSPHLESGKVKRESARQGRGRESDTGVAAQSLCS